MPVRTLLSRRLRSPLGFLAETPRTIDASTAQAPLQFGSRAIDPRHRLARLHQSLAENGGMVSAESVIGLLRKHRDQPLSLLARWIVDRRVLSIDDGGQRWLPMFQFDLHSLQVIDGVDRALGELRSVFDDDELVEWFATPNAWLAGRSPASLVATDASAVEAAARADRFVAAG